MLPLSYCEIKGSEVDHFNVNIDEYISKKGTNFEFDYLQIEMSLRGNRSIL